MHLTFLDVVVIRYYISGSPKLTGQLHLTAPHVHGLSVIVGPSLLLKSKADHLNKEEHRVCSFCHHSSIHRPNSLVLHLLTMASTVITSRRSAARLLDIGTSASTRSSARDLLVQAGRSRREVASTSVQACTCWNNSQTRSISSASGTPPASETLEPVNQADLIR